MVLVNNDQLEDVMQQFRAMGEKVFMIGEIQAAEEADNKSVTIEGLGRRQTD